MPIRLAADTLERVVAPYAEDVAGEVLDDFVERAQDKVSRRTGALHDSIEVTERPVAAGGVVRGKVEVGEEYGVYQDEGTGIYGPNAERIVPTDAQALTFDWPAAGGVVFFKSVAGTEPTRFWQRTVEEFPDIVRDHSA